MATILVVDDLRTDRRFLTALLGGHGHLMLEAADGVSALAIARARHPDLIISDVLMPVMDGYELVRQLRLDSETSAIPVVFYAAHYGEREARALALSGSVSDVLTKPAASADVLRTVGRALSGDSAAGRPVLVGSSTAEPDREHLRFLSDGAPQTASSQKTANARLRALVNIGLDFASDRDSGRRLHGVCAAARDLFGATYVTLGLLDQRSRTLQGFMACGADSLCEIDAANWIGAGDPAPGIYAAAVDGRRPVRGDNADGNPASLGLPSRHPEIHAYLVAPLASVARVYGWIGLVGNEGHSFTEDEEQLVAALAGHVGRIYELEHETRERQDLESALRQERDRAQRYLDTADVILLALDMSGRITLINRKGRDLLGATEAELLGCDFVQTCLPVRLRVAIAHRFQTVLAGDLSVVEAPLLTRSGGERVIEWHNTLVRDETGCVTGTFSSGADVTERRRAVRARETGEERTRFALESANVGIWDMDCTSGVTTWSPILEAQHGLDPGRFDGTQAAIMASVYPEDRVAFADVMAKARISGAEFSEEHRATWPDGTVRWLSGAGRYRLNMQGEPVRGVGISQDVTARHTLEGQFHQAQKMEAVGLLAGGVAHDFNNLLTAILGYCQLVLDDLGPDGAHRADIIEIQRAGESAAALTGQLLAFSRKEIVQATRLDLNRVVADMRPMLGRLIGEDVTIVLNEPSQSAPITADRGQVEQIVMNLAVNARDAMPKGGTLTIAISVVALAAPEAQALDGLTAGPYVVLTVTDTGQGMTPEVQARLFEPFFTTKEPGKGTGLGLATVHGIVTRSGGRVSVSSAVGAGTSLKMFFPRAGDVDVVAATPPAARPRVCVETVLVVEDADGLRELARRLLQRQGYTVLVAASADEAFRQFAAHPSIAAVLADVVLPGISGPELTKRLLAERPALKVIHMSGYTEEAMVRHGVQEAGTTFLHKPFTAGSLSRTLREVLDR